MRCYRCIRVYRESAGLLRSRERRPTRSVGRRSDLTPGLRTKRTLIEQVLLDVQVCYQSTWPMPSTMAPPSESGADAGSSSSAAWADVSGRARAPPVPQSRCSPLPPIDCHAPGRRCWSPAILNDRRPSFHNVLSTRVRVDVGTTLVGGAGPRPGVGDANRAGVCLYRTGAGAARVAVGVGQGLTLAHADTQHAERCCAAVVTSPIPMATAALSTKWSGEAAALATTANRRLRGRVGQRDSQRRPHIAPRLLYHVLPADRPPLAGSALR